MSDSKSKQESPDSLLIQKTLTQLKKMLKMTLKIMFTCGRFKDIQSQCFDIMIENDPNIKPEIMNNYELLEYVLNLSCPPECLVGCCQ